jgi:acyl phosphate:glycerol-3-phosphate acyltransferase
MEQHFEVAIALVLAYLLGSIPSSVWIGKGFFGIDVREHGSGNAGATNTLRVLGPKAGIVVLLMDAVKGFLAVWLSRWLGPGPDSGTFFQLFQLGLAIVAVLGHIFPVFAGFRGGKGIATLLGVVTALFPAAVGVCFIVFLLVFIPTRYVSLASITTAISFPLVLIFIFGENQLPFMIFSWVVAVLVPLTHHKNIRRLLKGEESKISFKKKKTA